MAASMYEFNDEKSSSITVSRSRYPGRRTMSDPAIDTPFQRPSALETPAELAWQTRLRKLSSAETSTSDRDGSRGRSPINMADRLQTFRARSESPEVPENLERKKSQRQSHHESKLRRQQIMEIFKAREKIDEEDPWKQILRLCVPWDTRPSIPDVEELAQVAEEMFTPRHDLTVYVCDFYEDHGENFKVALSDIEACWKMKPEGVVVRWIHAPLGRGLVHSSVEDRFRHDMPPGRSFQHAAYAGWLYPELDMLYLESRERLQDMRDVHTYISPIKDVTKRLEDTHFPVHLTGNPVAKHLHRDLVWRTELLRADNNFWALSESDNPSLLSEGISLTTESAIPVINRKRRLDPSALAIHPEYTGVQLVRAPFRCFHRQDGCLLTMSPCKGVNYISRDLKEHLSESGEEILENRDASVIAHVMKNFESTGTRDWHKKTVEYFMIYLLTEVGATPHTDLHGRSATAVLSGLQSVVQELKARRYDRWKPKTSVELVTSFLNTADELATLKDSFKNLTAFFKRLGQDIVKQDQEDSANRMLINNAKGETAISRIRWAASMVSRQADETDRLLSDLTQAMNTLFQLRSIEQNELAITADSQNKAILIFTGVTIVFLPLSFFTSYYGMNLEGIQNSSHGQDYFWKLCGTIAVAIVLLVTLFAFRHYFISRILIRKNPIKSSYNAV